MSLARTIPLRLRAAARLAVGAAAVQGTDLSCHGVLVRAVSPGQTIYVSKYDAASRVTTAVGFPLADGAVLDLQVKNVNELDFIASASAQAVALLPYSLY